MTDPYEDILSLPYPFPTRRKRMSLTERAAQFAPFAALSGFSDSITEAAGKSENFIRIPESAASGKNMNRK
jgi:hypothetical protein